jgi:hypothetical protein
VGLQFQAHSLRYRPLDDGFSMNIIVLFALILVVGMLVGNVDTELADRNCKKALAEAIPMRPSACRGPSSSLPQRCRFSFHFCSWSGMVGVREILTDHSYLTLSSCSWR